MGGFPNTLELIRLGRTEGVLVASSELPPELRDFNRSDQEKDISFVINEPRSVYRERMEEYLHAKNILLRNTIELWSIEAIKKSVAANLGISFLPRFAVKQELHEEVLIEIPIDMPQNTVTAICVHHRNREPGSAMLFFRKLLAEFRMD